MKAVILEISFVTFRTYIFTNVSWQPIDSNNGSEDTEINNVQIDDWFGDGQ